MRFPCATPGDWDACYTGRRYFYSLQRLRLALLLWQGRSSDLGVLLLWSAGFAKYGWHDGHVDAGY